MKKVYKTKVSIWLVCAIVGIVVISMTPVLACDFLWIALTVEALILCFVLYSLFDIRYVICDNVLSIKCGIFLIASCDINQIRQIKDTRSILSAPAASLDRIAIYLVKQKTPIVISPKDKIGFIRDLQSINPDIAYIGEL